MMDFESATIKELIKVQKSRERVKRFKFAHKIVSGKITKFITKKSIFETENNRFIDNIKYYIAHFGIENSYNSHKVVFN